MQLDDRGGDTVKPFDPEQSFDLLCQFLGPTHRDLKEQLLPHESEVRAAKEFLEQLQGLAQAIKLAAIIIKDENIGGPTIESTYHLFKEHATKLPERLSGKRSDTYHVLDTLWDMRFQLLTNNARKLLSVLSLLPVGKPL